MKSIYRNNPDINTNGEYVKKCSPDYFHIVSSTFPIIPPLGCNIRTLLGGMLTGMTGYFYGHIFSFDKILGDLETSQAIVSSLIGIDCTTQASNQMRGMMSNCASRDEVIMARSVVIMLAQKLNVHFKGEPAAVPELDATNS